MAVCPARGRGGLPGRSARPGIGDLGGKAVGRYRATGRPEQYSGPSYANAPMTTWPSGAKTPSRTCRYRVAVFGFAEQVEHRAVVPQVVAALRYPGEQIL